MMDTNFLSIIELEYQVHEQESNSNEKEIDFIVLTEKNENNEKEISNGLNFCTTNILWKKYWKIKRLIN